MDDLFRSRLGQTVNMRHELVRLADELGWEWIDEELQSLTGVEAKRIYVDKGYRGHDHPHKFRAFRSGQKRGVFGVIKRELRRRSAIEAVIGHLEADGHLGRNYLKGRHGDKINALLAGAGQNFRLLLRWFEALLCFILTRLLWRHTAYAV